MQATAVLHPAKQFAMHTASGQTTIAVIARSTARREWADNSIANSQRLHGTTQLDDFSKELVPHNGAYIEPGFTSKVGMQIRTTDRGQLDTDNDVVRIQNAWFGDILQHDVPDAAKSDRSHDNIVGRRDKK